MPSSDRRACAKCGVQHDTPPGGKWRSLPDLNRQEARQAALKDPNAEWICRKAWRELPESAKSRAASGPQSAQQPSSSAGASQEDHAGPQSPGSVTYRTRPWSDCDFAGLAVEKVLRSGPVAEEATMPPLKRLRMCVPPHPVATLPGPCTFVVAVHLRTVAVRSA